MSNLTHQIATVVPTVTGWCSVEKAQDLALAVLKTKSTVSVEIGVWGGRSVVPMALAHKEQGHGIVWAIDPWSPEASTDGYDKVNADWWGSQNHEVVYQRFLAVLKEQGIEDYVRVMRRKSDDVIPPDSIDILHVDGQHTDQAVKDIERFAVNVVVNGFTFVDDIKWTGGGVGRAVEKLLTMGFVKIFDRDTGAMFQRIDKRELPKLKNRADSVEKPVKKAGWPKGKKRGKKKAKK